MLADKDVDPTREPRDRKFLGSEKIMTIILLMVFVLVLITGLFTFLRLNRIVTAVSSGVRPDEKLLLVKEIYNNLSGAENEVKSYSLTRNEAYLSGFYETVRKTESQFDDLRALVPEGDTLQSIVDSLDLLVGRKFTILDNLLAIQDEYRVQQALNKVAESIRETYANDTLALDTITAEPKKKEGFFARIFRKKDKNKEPDTIGPAEPSLDEISQQLEEVSSAEMEKESRLRAKEWDLIKEDNEVMQKVKELVSRLEYMERNSFADKTSKAENNAKEIRVIIAAFCIAASLLLILAVLTIVRYVRSNNRYQEAMRRASREARELASTRERFLANMSHEIRTPMNVISGFTNQLLQSELKEGQKEQLSMVKKSADHLLLILNDVLDYSKLEAGKMELTLTAIDIRSIVNDMVAQFRPMAKEKNDTLEADIDSQLPGLLLGDSVRLRQILFNLVGNAVKFTESGAIRIRVRVEEEKNNAMKVSFEISDTGIGISENDLEIIFREFEQAKHARGKVSGGTGLGLTITRKLVELYDGDLLIKSEEGEGTAVHVTLPFKSYKEGEPNVKESKVDQAGLPEGLEILVVDDEEFNRKLLRTVLEKYRWEVSEAEGGIEALKIYRKQSFDLVLTDNRMPDMEGTQLCEAIRELRDREKAGVPVIVVTAAVSQQDREAYHAAGMDGFVAKPFEEKELIRTIGQCLPKKHFRDAASKNSSPSLSKTDEKAYDLDELRKMTRNEPEFFSEMLELFFRNTSKGLKEMHSCLKESDWNGMAMKAHKISSPCRHIGAENLYRSLKKIEENGYGEKDLDQMAPLLEAAQKEFELIRKDIGKKGLI